MENHGFHEITLPLNAELFDELSNSVEFEDVSDGRKGNHLVCLNEKEIPIVRSTTKYNMPPHDFSKTHLQIAEHIQQQANNIPELQGLSIHFNNALIEIYDHRYSKMKYHSDQSLDLEADSHIALFSCYERPEKLSKNALRKLKVKCKTTGEEFELILKNNSVILFSLATNSEFQHKIVLDPPAGAKQRDSANRWLGITFRQSKTFIHFKDNLPYFPSGALLQQADDSQSKEFYQLRAQENYGVNFMYPNITYTLSLGDTLEPKRN